MLSERDIFVAPASGRGVRDAVKGFVVRALHQVCALAPVDPETLQRVGPPAPAPDDESDGLEIRPSTIPHAGQGLFALRSFSSGETLCEYTGDVMTFWQHQRTRDWTYVVATGKNRFVNGERYPFAKARYINHHFDPEKINAVFFDAADGRILVNAIRPIRAGEEIYADYGARYWNRVRWNALVAGSPPGRPHDRVAHPQGARLGRPRVSIGVPVYNGEPFIGEALEAIAAQTFGNYEVIISDNASTDDTERICREYAARDPRVRYVRNERNIGLARNFQQLVRLASGEYFKLANADDVPAPRLVDECVAVLDAHPEVVLCYGKTILIDHQGRHLRPHVDGLHLREPSARARFREAVERTGLVNLLQGVIRTAALRRTAMLGTFTASDMVLVAELSLHGQFHELPEVLFYRRLHAAALSSVTTSEGLQGVWDPLKTKAERLIAWRHYRAYAGAIARAPIRVTDKLALFRWLAREAITGRRQLLLELLDAAGVGSKTRS